VIGGVQKKHIGRRWTRMDADKTEVWGVGCGSWAGRDCAFRELNSFLDERSQSRIRSFESLDWIVPSGAAWTETAGCAGLPRWSAFRFEKTVFVLHSVASDLRR